MHTQRYYAPQNSDYRFYFLIHRRFTTPLQPILDVWYSTCNITLTTCTTYSVCTSHRNGTKDRIGSKTVKSWHIRLQWRRHLGSEAQKTIQLSTQIEWTTKSNIDILINMAWSWRNSKVLHSMHLSKCAAVMTSDEQSTIIERNPDY